MSGRVAQKFFPPPYPFILQPPEPDFPYRCHTAASCGCSRGRPSHRCPLRCPHPSPCAVAAPCAAPHPSPCAVSQPPEELEDGRPLTTELSSRTQPTVRWTRGTMYMTCDERFAVLRSIGEECIYEDELCLLLKKKPNLVCYVWFEPSPVMDIQQGIMKTIYVNKMITAGCTVKILMADWFLQRHPKIGSNLNKIRTIGCYNIAMWKAAGMYLDRVEIIWFTDELNHHAFDYWPIAMDVSRKYTIRRIARYSPYMSPYGPSRLPAAELIYPCMQVAALLCPKLQVDMWLFSLDQRDTILLARDYCEDIKKGSKPPILLHGMLPNLLEDPEFEDERHPGRTIFMLDEEDDVNEKISCAFCPPKVAASNPCLEYIKSVILPWFGKFEVVQKEGDDSNNKTFLRIEELIVNYENGDLDPMDIKLALRKGINDILEFVGEYFRGNTEAQALITAPKYENQITSDILKIQMQNKEMFNL